MLKLETQSPSGKMDVDAEVKPSQGKPAQANGGGQNGNHSGGGGGGGSGNFRGRRGGRGGRGNSRGGHGGGGADRFQSGNGAAAAPAPAERSKWDDGGGSGGNQPKMAEVSSPDKAFYFIVCLTLSLLFRTGCCWRNWPPFQTRLQTCQSDHSQRASFPAAAVCTSAIWAAK